MLLIEAQVCH